MSQIQQNISKSNEKLAQLLEELKEINNNINKKKDLKAIDSNINNKYKSKVNLINKMKICSIIATNKQMKSNVKNNSNKDKKWFKCDYNKECIYKTKYKSHLNRHINTVHKKMKPFVCHWPRCRKSFGQLFNLKVHQLMHSGIKTFKCNFNNCNKTFTQKRNLINHQLIHS
jgi:uncharacterized Zn-finger protein